MSVGVFDSSGANLVINASSEPDHFTVGTGQTLWQGDIYIESGFTPQQCDVALFNTGNQPAITTTSNSITTTTPTTVTAPAVQMSSSGGVLGLSAAAQSAIRAGSFTGAGATPDAVVTCGPVNSSLIPGSDVACDVSCASVGNAVLILQVDRPNGSTFTPLVIGGDLACSSMTKAERSSYIALGHSC